MKSRLAVLALLAGLFSQALADEIKINIEKRYVNIPISHKVDRKKMHFLAEGLTEEPNDVRLADGEVDYWVFRDFSALKGKTLTIKFEGSRQGLNQIYQSDQIAGADSLYKESNRPQIHYTSKRGWMNDPNGLLYANGLYHLYVLSTQPLRTRMGQHALGPCSE